MAARGKFKSDYLFRLLFLLNVILPFLVNFVIKALLRAIQRQLASIAEVPFEDLVRLIGFIHHSRTVCSIIVQMI